MREFARDADPASQPGENRATARQTEGISDGKHCPMDSVVSSPAGSRGSPIKKGQTRVPVRLSLNQLRMIDQTLDPTGRSVLGFLRRFGVASTDQLRRLFYSERPSRHAGELACWRILHRLQNRGLIACLPRRVGGLAGGSTPRLWYLTNPGHRFTVMSGESQTAARHSVRLRPHEPPAWFTLQHRLMLTETYTRLHELTTSQRLDMLELTTEPFCWRRFANAGGGLTILKPDAFARTAAHGSTYEQLWFIEIDMGTESLATIRRKTKVYEAYRNSGLEQQRQSVFPKVIWITPDQTRVERLNAVFTEDQLAKGHEAAMLERFTRLAAAQ